MDMTVDEIYKDALDYLYSRLPMFSRVGAAAYKPGLETTLALNKYFGNPHKQFKSIHIAGTNGKGSTSHMLAAVLQSQGYKTALYTSPHLVDFRERIRINGKMIPKENVIEFVEQWKNSDFTGEPSFFELTMMMAFKWFADEKVDYAVIEVGMGGRLDSTNVITPILSVITNISHDHNQFLGDTLTAIAAEKAGIIKDKIPVVVGERQEECADVFLSKAKEMDAPILFASDSPLPTKMTHSLGGAWEVSYPGGDFTFHLGGDYQQKNIITVMAAIEKLRQRGILITDEALIEGIENVGSLTGLYGRWSILADSPLIIADTGHNIGGLTYNFNQLERMMNDRPYSKLRVVIGFVADKAIDKILNLLPRKAIYYITNASILRALSSDKLYDVMIEKGFDGKAFQNVGAAYREAKKEASWEDIIFVGGSTFIVADLLEELGLQNEID